MATLSDDEREALGDWWDSEWPDTAAGALGTLAETVEAILTARLAKAWDEGYHAGALGEHQWDPIPNPYRAALASDATHALDADGGRG